MCPLSCIVAYYVKRGIKHHCFDSRMSFQVLCLKEELFTVNHDPTQVANINFHWHKPGYSLKHALHIQNRILFSHIFPHPATTFPGQQAPMDGAFGTHYSFLVPSAKVTQPLLLGQILKVKRSVNTLKMEPSIT